MMVPIVKKGQREMESDYRGITITPTLYKIYAAVLGKRLKKEMEEKGLILPN